MMTLQEYLWDKGCYIRSSLENRAILSKEAEELQRGWDDYQQQEYDEKTDAALSLEKMQKQLDALQQNHESLKRIVSPDYHSDVCLFPCPLDHGNEYYYEKYPWADPDCDVLADIRAEMARAKEQSRYGRY